MNILFRLPVLLLGWLAGYGIPGELTAQSDTVMLREITINALDPGRYLPGGVRWFFPADTVSSGSLGQQIDEQLPFYFVQYGAPGQLASINLRGMGASRSSLVWQGIEINSFTLGQADYGELWLPAGNNIAVELGAVSALYGNGALGGTIKVGHQPKFGAGHQLSFNQDVGSFGQFATQLGYDNSSSRLHWSTRLFYGGANNDFLITKTGCAPSNAMQDLLPWGFSRICISVLMTNKTWVGTFGTTIWTGRFNPAVMTCNPKMSFKIVPSELHWTGPGVPKF